MMVPEAQKETPTAAGSSGSSSEEDDEDEEEVEEPPQGKWHLPVGESVYSEALFLPLIENHVMQQRPSGRVRRSRIFLATSHIITLVLNGVIQFEVLFKVRSLTMSRVKDSTGRLFHRLCSRDETLDMLPFTQLLDPVEPGNSYFNCAPITPILTAGAKLDLDGDGYWTLDEASELEATWEAKYPSKPNTIKNVWYYFRKNAKQDRLLGLRRPTVKLERKALTHNWTAMPMDWFQKDLSDLGLCAAADKNLCGNLEARGILTRFFPRQRVVQMRLTHCEDVMARCKEAFGQEYQVYVDWAGELCGAAHKTWIPKQKLIVTRYTKAHEYNGASDSITKQPYSFFLMVILLIWWMSMAEELSRVFSWWVVLVSFPSVAPPGVHTVEVTEDKISINAITNKFKIWTIAVNLLPRTIIAVCLSTVGTTFLLRADNYEDLILNSVALGFLIEVDNMLYTAVASDEVKQWMGMCQTLTVSFPIRVPIGCIKFHCPSRVRGPLTILLIALFFVVNSYFKSEGKFEFGRALKCLCHTADTDCVAAQFLGGTPVVEAEKDSG